MTPRPKRTDDATIEYAVPDVILCLEGMHMLDGDDKEDPAVITMARELAELAAEHRSNYAMVKHLDRKCWIHSDDVYDDLLDDMHKITDVVDKAYNTALATWVKAYNIVCPFVMDQKVRHIKDKWIGTIVKIYENKADVGVFSRALGHVTMEEATAKHRGCGALNRIVHCEELEAFTEPECIQ